MLEERLALLEQRLAQTEEELRTLREQLDAARSVTTAPARALGGGGLAAVLATVLAACGLVAATTTAQGPAKTHTVKAPFVVVNEDGNALFRIAAEGTTATVPFYVVKEGKPVMDVGVKDSRRLRLYNAGGEEVLGAGATTEGGKSASIVLGGNGSSLVGLQSETGDKKGGFYYSHDGKMICRLGEMGLVMFDESGKKGTEILVKGVGVYDKSERRIIRLGADPGSEFGSLVMGKAGKALVGLSMEKDAGVVVVRGMDDQSIVELGAPGVQVFNKNKAVGKLGFSPSGKGSGYLAIGNPGGDTIVEAGMLTDGDGVVRAYPLSGRTPVPIPNFIRGGKSDK